MSIVRAAGATGAAALVGALGLLGTFTAKAGSDASGSLLAGFEARSYRPGQTAVLRIDTAIATRLTLRLFLAGGTTPSGETGTSRDHLIFGEAMTQPRQLRRAHRNGPWLVRIRLGSSWPSGDYVARLSRPGHTDYAPFVLRPHRLGTAPVLVVEPTNTWEAYNVTDGDSWYLDHSVHVIDLSRPFAGSDVRGDRVPTGLPEQFFRLDLGFLRWYWRSGYEADFISDDDLEHVVSAGSLRHYRLIVFAGHEEYVTSHTYDLITRYRDEGGNLAFLSANNFFYRVQVSGDAMVGRTRWRDLGRPEAALVGAQYVGWNESRFANHPYRVVRAQAARWLFAGTDLHDGSRFGDYGIEIDEPNAASPPDRQILAVVPDEFGAGKPADMTIYRHGRSTVFDAGVLNFGASAHWPQISRFISNLWRHLSGEQPAVTP
jgi:N,N-dimethylformamidase beta subunit-like, C-terminal